MRRLLPGSPRTVVALGATTSGLLLAAASARRAPFLASDVEVQKVDPWTPWELGWLGELGSSAEARDLPRALAAALALALVGHPYLLEGESAPRLFPIVTGVAVVAGLVLWNEGAITLAAGALGLHYIGTLYLRDVEYDVAAPLVAVVIVLFIELADLGISVPPGTPIERTFVRARLNVYAGRIAVTVATVAVVYAGSAIPLPSTGPARVAGIAAGVVAVAVPAALLRRNP